MDVQTASPAPSTPPALPPPAPAQIEPAPAVHTPPAVPAHAVQAAPPPPTASHTPLRPASSALAQPAQAVVPSVKTAVPSPSAHPVTPPTVVNPANPNSTEAQLEKAVEALWQVHKQAKSSARKTNKELALIHLGMIGIESYA